MRDTRPCGGDAWERAIFDEEFQYQDTCYDCAHVAVEAFREDSRVAACAPVDDCKCMADYGYAFAKAAGIPLTTYPGGEE